MCFVGTEGRMVRGTRSEGGWSKICPSGVPTLPSAISLIPLWLSPMNRPPRAAREKKRGTRATPPQKRGGM